MHRSAKTVAAYIKESPTARQEALSRLYSLCHTDIMRSQRYQLNVKGATFQKGCIRYPTAAKIDFDVVTKLLRAMNEATGDVC